MLKIMRYVCMYVCMHLPTYLPSSSATCPPMMGKMTRAKEPAEPNRPIR